MKKILGFLIISLLIMSTVTAVVEESDVTILPDEGLRYLWNVRVKEFFSNAISIFNREQLIEKQLDQIERRRIEFDKLAEKFETAENDEAKVRIRIILEKTEERRLKTVNRIQAKFTKISEEKRLRTIALMEQHKERLEEMKDRLQELQETLRKAVENMEISISEASEDTFTNPLLEGACGDKGAILGEMNVRLPTLTDHVFKLPVCLCDSTSQCSEGSQCLDTAGDITLEHKICHKPKR